MSARPAQDEDDDLADLKCLVLESMRDTLERNIDPSKFLPYLRSKFVISARENATIKACCAKSVYDGAEKFIDVLCTKGSKGYDQFCIAIMRDETQLYLLKALNKRLEREKHNRREQRERLGQQQMAAIQRRLRQDPSQVQPYVPPCPRPSALGGEGAQSAHTTSCIGYINQEHYLRSRESPNQQFSTIMGSLGYQQPANSPLQPFPGSPLHSPSSVMTPCYQQPVSSPLQNPGSLGYQQPVVQPPGSLGFESQFPFQPRAPEVSVPWGDTMFSPSSDQEDGPRGQRQIVP